MSHSNPKPAERVHSQHQPPPAAPIPSPDLPPTLRQFDQLPDSANVRQPVVQMLFGISAATVWRRVLAGELPMPRKYGTRTTTWNVGELRAALAKGSQE